MAQYVRPDPPSASWLHPDKLRGDDYAMKAGRILLGQTRDGRQIGIDDNRHIATLAGSRAGKSVTSLMSNLVTWDGSTMVVDPKGELAMATASHRAKMGQKVFILDPFKVVKGDAEKYRVGFNPLDETKAGHPDDIVDDAGTIAEAMITSDDGKNDHWSLSAKNLIRGLALYVMHQKPQDGDLNDLRFLLTSPAERAKNAPEGARMSLAEHFGIMAKIDAYDGVLAGVGASMAGKPKTERGSIISTAIEQTAFLDSLPMRTHLKGGDLTSMRVLKQERTSIYLVLPSSRMASHFRWLRVILTQAMTALEREENATGRPVLFILEEFPTLGYMRLIEASAGLMAGYDVKLWTVLQDLSQLQAHYPKSWETFLGNAGIVEAFGNTDMTTLDYLSRRMGNTLSQQAQPDNPSIQAQQGGARDERQTIVTVPLLAPHEISQKFARREQNKLILSDEKPFAVGRIYWKDLLDG